MAGQQCPLAGRSPGRHCPLEGSLGNPASGSRSGPGQDLLTQTECSRGGGRGGGSYPSSIPGGGGVSPCPRLPGGHPRPIHLPRALKGFLRPPLWGRVPQGSWGGTEQQPSFTVNGVCSPVLCAQHWARQRGHSAATPPGPTLPQRWQPAPPIPAEWESGGCTPGSCSGVGTWAGLAPELAHADPGLSSTRLPFPSPGPQRDMPTPLQSGW